MSNAPQIPGNEVVHAWFGLSYANYLVLPRSVLQSMPGDWQARLVALLDELHEDYGHLDWPTYDVRCYAREPELLHTLPCDECEGEGTMAFGETCEECHGSGEVEIDTRYETIEETGVRRDPIPHYNRGRTWIEPRV